VLPLVDVDAEVTARTVPGAVSESGPVGGGDGVYSG